MLELCRLRVAQLVGCPSELAIRYAPAVEAGLDEAKVTALGSSDRDVFSETETACLTFAELFVRDPHAIRDSDAAAVVGRLGPEATVAFVEALALFDGFARFRAVLGIEPESDEVRVVPAPAPGDAPLP